MVRQTTYLVPQGLIFWNQVFDDIRCSSVSLLLTIDQLVCHDARYFGKVQKFPILCLHGHFMKSVLIDTVYRVRLSWFWGDNVKSCDLCLTGANGNVELSMSLHQCIPGQTQPFRSTVVEVIATGKPQCHFLGYFLYGCTASFKQFRWGNNSQCRK